MFPRRCGGRRDLLGLVLAVVGSGTVLAQRRRTGTVGRSSGTTSMSQQECRANQNSRALAFAGMLPNIA